jgi:hypothetical protein
MFRSRGLGFPVERDDDAFTSAVDSLIFPVSQTAGFDFSAFAADGHQTPLLGLQGEVPGSPHPGLVTEAASTSGSTDITMQPLGAGALTFTLHNIGGVTPGSQAEAGFERATALWQSFLGDAVTIRLDVGFSSLGPGILGSTGSAGKVVSYSAVRAALTADQSSSDDATAVASLSAGSSLSFFTDNSAGARVFDSDGSSNNSYLSVNTANLKALGITTDANGRPVDTGAADGSISFSSDFTWDFDPGNGITAGAIDFVGVAVHEIGHALGFESGVDIVDYYSGFGPGAPLNLNPYAIFSTLDLFRYSGAGVRDLSYGGTKYFSLNGGLTNLALFSTGDFQGDGNQASHWKDGLGIGIMDPTSVPAGQANVVTSRDIQAMDVIGWNLVSNSGPGSISNHARVNDFNGDSFSDILWRNNSSGDTGYSDPHNNAWHGLGASSTAYRVVGTGDFNGDGFGDALWRNNSSGDTGYTDFHAGNAWHGLGASSTAYSIAATGDFNGDGFSDILYRNGVSGDTGYSDQHNANAWHGLGAASTAYSVVGTGDFNGDGFSDALWRNNSSGDTGYTDFHADNAWHGLGASSTAYNVVGVGDFNGDGFSDVLWRNNSSGDTGYTDFHAGNAWHGLGASSTAYSIVGTGDFNGDGFGDILYRNSSSGDTGYLDLHGNAWHGLGAASTAYLIAA